MPILTAGDGNMRQDRHTSRAAAAEGTKKQGGAGGAPP